MLLRVCVFCFWFSYPSILVYVGNVSASGELSSPFRQLPPWPVVSSPSPRCVVAAGALLQYSIYLCTRANSPLTTSVVGCFKNLVTTIAGMLGVGSDYAFDAKNGVGLAISMAGSFLYSWGKVVER